jgi:hypothetical protein
LKIEFFGPSKVPGRPIAHIVIVPMVAKLAIALKHGTYIQPFRTTVKHFAGFPRKRQVVVPDIESTSLGG